MNSYTVKIADYDLRLRCELTPEALDEIVKKVDGYITTMCSRSTNISKTEAAILCALEFCFECEQNEQDRSADDGAREQLTEENKKLSAQVAKLETRLEAQKEKFEAAAATQKERADAAVLTQKEKYEGRIENMKEKYEARIAQLKAKVDELRSGALQQMSMDIPAEEAPAAPAEPAAPEAAVVEPEPAPAAEQVPVAEPAAEAADKAKKSKSKVGSMFELLTYGDV